MTEANPDAVPFTTLRCDCGSAEIAAVAPGDETVRSDLLDLALDAGRPLIAWCMACWVQRFGR